MFEDINFIKKKGKEEYEQRQKVLVENAKNIISSKDFEIFMGNFQDFERFIIRKMIAHKAKDAQAGYIFYNNCLAKLTVFYDIFEPLLETLEKNNKMRKIKDLLIEGE